MSIADATSKANRIAYDLPIRKGTKIVTVYAPRDFNLDDAKRISILLEALAIPAEPSDG